MANLVLVARMSADSLDIEALEQRFDQGSLSVARSGKPPRGQFGDNVCALNISLGDFTQARDAIHTALKFLTDARDLIQAVRAQNGSVEIDFGMLVGAKESYAPSVTFTAATLRTFAASSVAIVVSAYPCSE